MEKMNFGNQGPHFFLITGTFHGSHITAPTEGEARRAFHAWWKGESIVHIASSYGILQESRLPWKVARWRDFDPSTGEYVGDQDYL